MKKTLYCFFERTEDVTVGVILLIIGIVFIILSFTFLPVIGLIIAIPVLVLAIIFLGAPRSETCKMMTEKTRKFLSEKKSQ
jgi:multisubunit Na+/H+ antiporter MnhG subunit